MACLNIPHPAPAASTRRDAPVRWAPRSLGLAALALGLCLPSGARAQPEDHTFENIGSAQSTLRSVDKLEEVPVGVAISRTGRLFLSHSRAIDPGVTTSLDEMVDGAPLPFPAGYSQDVGTPALDRLLSVQALTIDAKDRLWILDTGRVGDQPVQAGAPKLLAVDLRTNKVVRMITFPPSVAGPTSFFNDVRIDLSKGAAGVAFITDCSPKGPTGIVVADLASGSSFRRLDDHPSTRPQPGLVSVVEDRKLIETQGRNAGKPHPVGIDGIALDPTGAWVWYSPNSSHHLYRVSSAALADRTIDDREVASTVQDMGDKAFASDGLLADAQGRLYLTDYEHNAIVRREADGQLKLLVQGPKLLWPDSMALSSDGRLIFTATQIERMPRFRGRDERTKPFELWSVQTDSTPLMLSRGGRAQGRAHRRR